MAATVRSSSIGTAQDAPIVIPRPSGVADDDLLFAVYFGDAGTSGVNASGWSNIASRNESELCCRVLRRVATGGEPSTYTVNQPVNADGIVHLIAIKDADPDIAAKVAFAVNTSDTLITPNVNPAAANHLEIRAGCMSPFPGTLTFAAPSSYQMRGQTNAPAGFIASAAATRQINSSTGSGLKSFTVTPTATRAGLGVTISVASADLGPPPESPPPFTPGRGVSLYRYVLRNWGGLYLDDIEFTDVTFSKFLLRAGTFSGGIPIPNQKIAQRVARVIPRDAAGVGGITNLGIGPGVILAEIYRDTDPWGEYWLTSARINRSAGGIPVIQVRGATVDAYLQYVELQEQLDYADEDQLDIARALLGHMQSQSHAALNLILQAGTSGVNRTITYPADQASYGRLLVDLAESDGGFEWTINHTLGTSGLERHWVYGYPKLISDGVAHVFADSPGGGDILEWSEDYDALRGGTSWRARGGTAPATAADASTSSTPLMSAPQQANAYLDAGWPRIDRTITYPHITDQSLLDDYAAYWAGVAGGPLRNDSITVALSGNPTFTPNNLGDQARLFFNNPWHLPHSRVRRIIGMTVTPASKKAGKEQADLVFEGLEVDGG